MMKLRSLEKVYRVTHGKRFRLRDVDPSDTRGLEAGSEAEDLLARGIERMRELQPRLYAQDRWAVLLIFQAMDAAGKDGTIAHVMSGVNPQGCQVHSFKAPSGIELDHDYLWRTTCALPERGRIGIFNRSYYEEVLVVRVHREILAMQKLPEELGTKHIWKERHQDMRHFESYLTRNGIVVRKFFLYVSKEEQRRRFLARLEDPTKRWKFSAADVRERQNWDDYMRAYEDAIRATATPDAPWYVVPADHKWFTRCVVAAAIVDALEDLDLHFPKVDPARRREIEQARRALLRER